MSTIAPLQNKLGTNSEFCMKGDKKVRNVKLQMTLPKFDDLRMLESKTFSAFYKKVEMLTNEALGLGKPINETTVMKKILRTLSKRF